MRVKVRITLQLKRQVWFVDSYHVDSADGGQLLVLPPLLKRKFFSHEAAVTYMQRMVRGRLKLSGHDVAGSEMTCDVHVLPPKETQ